MVISSGCTGFIAHPLYDQIVYGNEKPKAHGDDVFIFGSVGAAGDLFLAYESYSYLRKAKGKGTALLVTIPLEAVLTFFDLFLTAYSTAHDGIY